MSVEIDQTRLDEFEWPTLLLLIVTYGMFYLGAAVLYPDFPIFAFIFMVLAGVFHSSLTHEMLHGHPFKSSFWNGALVFPAISIFIPYLRFRDTHLAHHCDERLTDPYDDPETNYLDPVVWAKVSLTMRVLLRMNNTLLGRILLGPILSQLNFMIGDFKLILGGDRRVLLGWLLHIPALTVVVAWLFTQTQMTLWFWVITSYAALGVLKIRTFLEHQAHEQSCGRTVVIEDRGPLALMFLNNNFHAVHHAHPKIVWYKLPAKYFANRDAYLERNFGYHFANYGQIFAKYLLKSKDPVPHPLWPNQKN